MSERAPRLTLAVTAEPVYAPEGAAPRWQDHANCRGVDPDLFFPERGGATAQAKAVCAGCLAQAIADGERFGIWGGLSERQRRSLRNGGRTRARIGIGPNDRILNLLADHGGTWTGSVLALADEARMTSPSVHARANRGLLTLDASGDGTGRRTTAIHLTADGWNAIGRTKAEAEA